MKTNVKIAFVLILVALLLSACNADYSVVNMPDDAQCYAAGYDVYTALVGAPNKLACINDAINDGTLDGR